MNRITRKVLTVGFLLAAAGGINAQQKAINSKVNSPRPPSNETSPVKADEEFDLDIKERRITETNYENSTAVAVGADDPRNFRVQVGVALRAQSLDVLMRNVTGSVRFHGSLERILDLVKARPPR